MRPAAPEMKPSSTTTLAGQGAAQHHAGQHANLEAPNLGEDIKAVAGVGAVRFEGAPDYSNLVIQLLVVSSCSPPCGFVWRFPRQDRSYGAGRGSVADSHVAEAEYVGPIVGDLLGNANPCVDAGLGLAAGHGRALGYVGGSAAHADHFQVWVVRAAGRPRRRRR